MSSFYPSPNARGKEGPSEIIVLLSTFSPELSANSSGVQRIKPYWLISPMQLIEAIGSLAILGTNKLWDQLTVHVGEAEISTLITVGKFFMI